MKKRIHRNMPETSLVDEFFQRLVWAYGYSVEQMSRDVALSSTARADIAIWRTAEAKRSQSLPDICVVVLCREEHVKIDADNYLAAYKESSIGSVNFFVLHNLKETKVFFLDSSHPMGGVERIGDFPKANDVLTEEATQHFIIRMRHNTKDALLQALERCHNVVRNNDKLSPEGAFDEISKVMCVKMMYERNPDGELIFSSGKFLNDEKNFLDIHPKGDFIAHLFGEVKKHFADDVLYEEFDRIRLCRKSFIAILKELEVIDFYDMTEDVKGVAFESLVGKTFRGELGQFFTPRQVVDYMVEVLDIKEGEKVCDPCCGSGGFLIRAFEHVQDAIDRDVQKRIIVVQKSSLPDTEKRHRVTKLLKECDKRIANSRYGRLCREYFFGVDANPRMARTAKMNMIMHGDGHVGVYLHDGLLNIGEVRDGCFDVVLINPPYGVHVDRAAKAEDGMPVLSEYETKQSAAELLFVERVVRLLKPGGRAGLVLPEGVFTNTNLKGFRKAMEGKAAILNITAMPPSVFLASGANVKPNLLFIRKYTDEEVQRGRQRGDKVCVSNADEDGLKILMPRVREWISHGRAAEGDDLHVIKRDDMLDWAVAPLFSAPHIEFNTNYPGVALSDLLTFSPEKTVLHDGVCYSRITVRLGGKGIVLRDRVLGEKIGTKRQYVVHSGQLVVSKIDGKSGAVAVVPDEFEGAIVTSDFPVFNIDASKVLPDYLVLILCHPSVLRHLAATTSGSTGRRRLSVPRFLALHIALPPLSKQEQMLTRIRRLREEARRLEHLLGESVQSFYSNVFN